MGKDWINFILKGERSEEERYGLEWKVGERIGMALCSYSKVPDWIVPEGKGTDRNGKKCMGQNRIGGDMIGCDSKGMDWVYIHTQWRGMKSNGTEEIGKEWKNNKR